MSHDPRFASPAQEAEYYRLLGWGPAQIAQYKREIASALSPSEARGAMGFLVSMARKGDKRAQDSLAAVGVDWRYVAPPYDPDAPSKKRASTPVTRKLRSNPLLAIVGAPLGNPPRRAFRYAASKRELAIGTRIEMEHTRSKRVARRIAREHLAERPDYYTRMRACGLANPPTGDEELRLLERAAATGDPEAGAHLRALKIRLGRPVPAIGFPFYATKRYLVLRIDYPNGPTKPGIYGLVSEHDTMTRATQARYAFVDAAIDSGMGPGAASMLFVVRGRDLPESPGLAKRVRETAERKLGPRYNPSAALARYGPDAERWWEEAKQAALARGFSPESERFWRYTHGIVKRRAQFAARANPGSGDEELRRLERAASAGDAQAMARLTEMRRRAGKLGGRKLALWSPPKGAVVLTMALDGGSWVWPEHAPLPPGIAPYPSGKGGERRFVIETRGPWGLISKLTGLAVEYHLVGDVRIPGTAIVYGDRSLDKPREDGYQMRGTVAVGGKKRPSWTSSMMIRHGPNGPYYNLAVIVVGSPRLRRGGTESQVRAQANPMLAIVGAPNPNTPSCRHRRCRRANPDGLGVCLLAGAVSGVASAVVTASMRRGRNPTDNNRSGNRGYRRTIPIAQAMMQLGSMPDAFRRSFMKAIARFKKFHGILPVNVSFYVYPDGHSQVTHRALAVLGPVPELHYLGPDSGSPLEKSNKAKTHWVHKTSARSMPFIGLDPETETHRVFGGALRTSNWMYH